MEEFDGANWSGAVVVTNERDVQLAKKVATRFFMKPKLDKATSTDGDPKFKDVEYVEMYLPGDKNNIVCKPVDKRVRALYRDRYERWKAGQQDALDGTPIELLPGVMPSQVEELRYHKIRTIEDMAGVSDEVLQRLGVGYRATSVKAQKYLDTKASAAGDEKLRAAMAQKDEELTLLRKRLEALESKEAKPKTEKQPKAG